MKRIPAISALAAVLFLVSFASPRGVAAEGALEVRLETCYVVDGRGVLRGTIEAAGDRRLHIRVRRLGEGTERWDHAISPPEGTGPAVDFALPLEELRGGYYRMRVVAEPGSGREEETGRFPPIGEGGPVVDFAVLQEKPASGEAPAEGRQRYLDFVIETIEKLLRHQGCPLGGDATGVRLVAVGGKDAPPRRELVRDGEGRALRSVPVRVQGAGLSPEFFEPYGADLDAWFVLDLLSEVTGDARFSDRVSEMAEAFVEHGFDPRSGLGYFGEEAQLDVFRLRPVNRRRSVRPLYKHGPDLPMARLWRHAPGRMHRMSKAMYFGLVTDAGEMAYNRFCDYGFDDGARVHQLEPSERHGAFESAAGGLLQWWGACFARTGDRECLEWAGRLAEKWEAVQHPGSGLVPYSLPWQRPPTNPNTRGGSKFAVALLEAARDFRKRPEGESLAGQLEAMGLKLARGVARHGYDEEGGRFQESLRPDGRPGPSVTPRFFSGEKEKRELVERDPDARMVPVYANGESFYLEGPYWRYTTGLRTPLHLAKAARLTGDEELIGRTAIIVGGIMRESRGLTSEFTPQGKWTFSGTGLYLEAIVLMHEATGDACYLRWARELADGELDRLGRVVYPHWWRTSERHDFLKGLLRLYAALEEEGAG